jgi:3-oxoacyl-[acyl-carrier protein] reductase
MITFDFKGQTAVVTGGTRGIGAAITEALLDAGASVIATYASNRESAEQFAACHQTDGRLEIQQFNVALYDEVEAFFRQLDSTCDSLEILVNNAGIRRDSVVGMMPRKDWAAVLDTNLTGMYNMSKFAVMKMMQNRYGRIVTITSPSGRLGFEGQANYAASKAGQVAFTKSLAREVAKRKITVNCVSPGFIETDFIAELTEDQLKAYKSMVPMRRFGEPSDVANAVLFLASEESRYITGSVVDVTGGL